MGLVASTASASTKTATNGAKVSITNVTKKAQGKALVLPKVIGMPPIPNNANSNIHDLWRNSSLVASIYPCSPNFSPDANLFSLTYDKQYFADLSQYLYATPSENAACIQVCFQAENLPSETFSNEYGDSMFARMTDVVSQGVSDIMQITNTRSGTEGAKKIASLLKETGGMGAEFGGALSGSVDKLQAWSKTPGTAGKQFAARAAQAADVLLGGGRLDFPQVWKNSTFTSSYSFNIRLYNPSPGNKKSSDYFIWGPLTALLLLALPRKNPKSTSDFFAFNYPYFVKVVCKGLFGVKEGCVTGISINKGSENQIAFNQNIGMIDVKIDFAFIYNHLIASSDDSDGVPTLIRYINDLKDSEPVQPMYKDSEVEKGADTINKLHNDSTTNNVAFTENQGASSRVNSSDQKVATNLESKTNTSNLSPPF